MKCQACNGPIDEGCKDPPAFDPKFCIKGVLSGPFGVVDHFGLVAPDFGPAQALTMPAQRPAPRQTGPLPSFVTPCRSRVIVPQ